MGFNCGIVGLPNVGKSTIFNALTSARAEAQNFPFCTIDPNVGIVPIPDPRLNKLAKMSKSKKVIPTSLEVVDIAGLVSGASKGEGLGNKFLGHIREVDAIAHVVRCFDDGDISHVAGNIDPVSDIEVVRTELLLSDLATLDKRIKQFTKLIKTGDKKQLEVLNRCESLKEAMEMGKMASMAIADTEFKLFSDLHLLTAKPFIYVCNVSEEMLSDESEHIKAVEQLANSDGTSAVKICGKIESELSELDVNDKHEFLSHLGLKEPGLNNFISEGYRLLGLITYLTTGPQETRAWTISKGSKAPQAAGLIHTDFEKGFIKAEIMSFDDLVTLGSEQAVKEKGLMRIEGRDYIMKDGDVAHFRFNV